MPNHIVLYQPEIPQNTGNIIRTCAGTDTKVHLIKPLGFSIDEKNLKRSAANYFKEAEVTVYENWEDFESKNDGKFFFLTRYGKKPHSEFDLSNHEENLYFILGSESSGIPKEILRPYLETCLRLPMNDKIRSLNVSNVAAILVYEALRQQEYNTLLRKEPFKSEDWIIED
jgi:tRNA (cytidine/uridine-2'-O-)-methyltransferase